MANIYSRYEERPITSVSRQYDIKSLADLKDLRSQYDFDILSLVNTFIDADEVASLKGAFASCSVDDWKRAKAEYLSESK